MASFLKRSILLEVLRPTSIISRPGYSPSFIWKLFSKWLLPQDITFDFQHHAKKKKKKKKLPIWTNVHWYPWVTVRWLGDCKVSFKSTKHSCSIPSPFKVRGKVMQTGVQWWIAAPCRVSAQQGTAVIISGGVVVSCLNLKLISAIGDLIAGSWG